MEFRRFTKEDYTFYASWFADPWLNQALGPMDEEWLEYILQDSSGTQYAIFNSNEMIAVLGVVWAPSVEAYHLVSDLAICPEKRRQGIGLQVLKALLELSDLPPAKGWLTYVDAHNPKALRFMEKMNWMIQERTPMVAFIYTY
jgi:GNAT superfamily N-acetyltransferase